MQGWQQAKPTWAQDAKGGHNRGGAGTPPVSLPLCGVPLGGNNS